MTNYRKPGLVLLLGLVFFIVFRFGQGSLSEGAKPYPLSRLEYVALNMNSLNGRELGVGSDYSMIFTPLETKNTLRIAVLCTPDTDRAAMNRNIQHVRSELMADAKFHGWDGWFRIEEAIMMTD